LPTPTTAFADAAAEYGNGDPNDIEAVQRWFAEELLKLSPDVIERVLHDLLQRDGETPEREMIPSYPDRVPLPSLGSSPQVTPPLLAEEWKRVIARLFARLRRR
jgi:hypothetical protein